MSTMHSIQAICTKSSMFETTGEIDNYDKIYSLVEYMKGIVEAVSE